MLADQHAVIVEVEGPFVSTNFSISGRLAGVALAAVAAITLAACDSEQVGAAAVVGDHTITVEDVQEQAQELIDTPGSGLDDTHDYTQLQRDLLSREILARVMDQVAENHGIEITGAAVDELVAQQFEALPPDQDIDALLAEAMYTRETFERAARSQLIGNQVVGPGGDQTALVAEADKAVEQLGVEVNPRYGEWGDDFVVDDVSGSISTPAGEDEWADEEAQGAATDEHGN